jgi:hypothetical protein
MFVYSIKAGTLKFFGAVLLSVALFLTILVLADPGGVVAGAEEYTEAVTYSGVKTDADRVAFLASFGWKTTSEAPVGEVSFTMPEEFDRVLAGYNEIQKGQGLDLARYKNKKVTRYTYEISNYDGAEGKVYANILVYRNKVIGGDICSADTNGFIHGFDKT